LKANLDPNLDLKDGMSPISETNFVGTLAVFRSTFVVSLREEDGV
jgi:hypothetical protein